MILMRIANMMIQHHLDLTSSRQNLFIKLANTTSPRTYSGRLSGTSSIAIPIRVIRVRVLPHTQSTTYYHNSTVRIQPKYVFGIVAR